MDGPKAITGVNVSVKVVLHGPFSGGAMSTSLRETGWIPLAHPYNRNPWAYGGPESVAAIPVHVVDWVLVELLTGDPATPPMIVQARRAGFVLGNGQVVDMDGSSALHFSDTEAGSYFIVVRHRNHLAVMSALAVKLGSETAVYDYTDAMEKAYGSPNGMRDLGGGKFGMFAGDADANGQVQNTDKNLHWAPHNGTAGYLAPDSSSPDFDLNGQVQNTDKNLLWAINVGKGSQVPKFIGLVTNSLGMTFRDPPLTSFSMGSNDGQTDETPVHTISFTHGFWVSVFEVTQKQWKAVYGTDPSEYPDCPGEVDDDCPVEWVTWFEAIGFANALSEKEGLSPCFDTAGNVIGGTGGNVYLCEGYRLPTEAEWEYFTRAGFTTEYSFGEDYPPTKLADYAWFEDNAGYTTHPVGTKLPNPWGLHDVHGNVWEWVYDWYQDTFYQVSPSTDPQGPATGTSKVLRGGAFYYYDGGARSPNRYAEVPDQHRAKGFRLARTIH